jgi:hypothetical protein
LLLLYSRVQEYERSKRNQPSLGIVGESLSCCVKRMIAAVRVALPLMNWPENSSRQPRYVAFLLMIVAAAAYYPRFVKLPAGMETYPQAASCLWYGQVLQVCDPGFTYPPFFALVMLPFAPMPPWLRDLVWYGVTLAATLGAFKLSEVLACQSLPAPLKRAELFWLRFFVLLLSAKLILAVFENQAYDALVLVAVLLGLSALSGDRPLTAGASLALAAALKATPLIFLPYLLWKRYFVAAAAFALVYATASILPDIFFAPAGSPGYFSTWLGEVAGPALGIDPAGAPFAFWDGANIRRGGAQCRRGASPQLVRGGAGLRRRLLHRRGRNPACSVAAPAAIDRDRRRTLARGHADALADNQPLALCRVASSLYDARGVQLARSAQRPTWPRRASNKFRLGDARRQRRRGGGFHRLGLSAQRHGAGHARVADLFCGLGDRAVTTSAIGWA